MLSSLLLHLLQILYSLGCPQLAAVSHTHQVPLSRGGSVSRLNWLWGRRETTWVSTSLETLGYSWKAMVGWIVHSDVNKVLNLALKNCTLHLHTEICLRSVARFHGSKKGSTSAPPSWAGLKFKTSRGMREANTFVSSLAEGSLA